MIKIPQKPKLVRQTSWNSVRKNHLKQQPECQACGSKTKLEVHHIIPVHVDPNKELDPDNLITLCENPSTGFCHYIFGHLSISWWKYNPYVDADTESHFDSVFNANKYQDARGMTTNET